MTTGTGMDAEFQQIRYAVADGVATITLNRPGPAERVHRRRCAVELIAAFDRADADDECAP